jgi:hypothetical protein
MAEDPLHRREVNDSRSKDLTVDNILLLPLLRRREFSHWLNRSDRMLKPSRFLCIPRLQLTKQKQAGEILVTSRWNGAHYTAVAPRRILQSAFKDLGLSRLHACFQDSNAVPRSTL